MELQFDEVCEVKVFACSHSLMTNDDEHAGVCYLESNTCLANRALKSLIAEVLYDKEYEIIDKSNYCCDTEFMKGFMVWQV